MQAITLILQQMERGEAGAADQLTTTVYDELHRLAAAKMAREPADHTLQPTALVHEAWLRLGADHQPNWQNRAHFFGAAAEAMRRGDLNRGNGVEVDSFSSFGLQVSRSFRRETGRLLGGTRLTLGVDNVLDQEPPLDYALAGYRVGNIRRPAGRFFYAEVKRTY